MVYIPEVIASQYESERTQEREHRWRWLPGLCAASTDASSLPERFESLSLHLQVRGDVLDGRRDAGVAKVVTYHAHVYPCLQKCHGAAVPEHMRRHVWLAKTWAQFTCA
jgi:hypothetical protein